MPDYWTPTDKRILALLLTTAVFLAILILGSAGGCQP